MTTNTSSAKLDRSLGANKLTLVAGADLEIECSSEGSISENGFKKANNYYAKNSATLEEESDPYEDDFEDD